MQQVLHGFIVFYFGIFRLRNYVQFAMKTDQLLLEK
jgi:hypothetical protein